MKAAQRTPIRLCQTFCRRATGQAPASFSISLPLFDVFFLSTCIQYVAFYMMISPSTSLSPSRTDFSLFLPIGRAYQWKEPSDRSPSTGRLGIFQQLSKKGAGSFVAENFWGKSEDVGNEERIW